MICEIDILLDVHRIFAHLLGVSSRFVVESCYVLSLVYFS